MKNQYEELKAQNALLESQKETLVESELQNQAQADFQFSERIQKEKDELNRLELEVA